MGQPNSTIRGHWIGTRKSSKYHRIEIVTVVECIVYDEHVE